MKRIALIYILSVALVSLAAISCSDDDDDATPTGSTSPSVRGGWEVVAGHPASYMILTSDNVIHSLYEFDMGFRTKQSSMYIAHAGQLVVEFEFVTVYNLTFAGDTLRLSSPETTIELVRDPGAPTAESWVIPLTPTVEFPAPVEDALDPAWYGNRLWYPNGRESDHIYELNPTSGAIEDSAAIPYDAYTLEWVGDDLWVNHGSSDLLRQYDPGSGTTPRIISIPDNWILGLGWDGQSLWAGSDGARTVYQYDLSADSVLDSIPLDRSIDGMTWANGRLYVCSSGLLNELQLSPPAVVGVYEVPGSEIRGVAFDGVAFWVSLDDWPVKRLARVTL